MSVICLQNTDGYRETQGSCESVAFENTARFYWKDFRQCIIILKVSRRYTWTNELLTLHVVGHHYFPLLYNIQIYIFPISCHIFCNCSASYNFVSLEKLDIISDLCIC